jgi:hypothetical protein
MSAIWSCDDYDIMKVSANLSASTNNYCYLVEIQRKPIELNGELTYAQLGANDHNVPVDTADDALLDLLIPSVNTFISGLAASYDGSIFAPPDLNTPIKFTEKTGI